VLVGWNDLATVNPELGAQLLDPGMAKGVTAFSNRSVAWLCEGTAEAPHPRFVWSAIISNRSQGRGCALCVGKVVLVGWNDLATANPKLAAQLVDPGIAKTVTPGSNKRADWFCEGTTEAPHPRHEWSTTISHRSRGTGCEVCVGKVVLVGWNDLATANPQLAAQLVDPSIARTVTAGSSRLVDWFCDGTTEAPHPRREWTTTVGGRSSGKGCAACSGKSVLVGWNDLATVNPGLAAQLVDPRVAETVTAYSHRSVEWFCEGTTEGPHPRHEWAAAIAHRSSGSGCAVCAGRRVLVGWNDLATVNSELAAQLVDPSIARTVTAGSSRLVDWFCDGTTEAPHPRREWSAAVANRSSGAGCGACSAKALLVGWNDLASVSPELAAQMVDPSIAATVTAFSHRSVEWFCEGTAEAPHPRLVWSSTVANRSSGYGCPTCARTGFDPSKPGWLYFLRHDGWHMQQIGITNNPDERTGQHERAGWQLIEVRKFNNGALCSSTETAALRALRKRGARLGERSDATAIKFDGFTEAWTTGSLELAGLQQLLDWVRNDEWSRFSNG
jgi:hypothetical protein